MSMKVDLTDNSDKVLAAFLKQVEDGMIVIGETAEKHAKENCPVDTGRLRGSITYATHTQHSAPESPAGGEDSSPKANPPVGEVIIGTNVEYAAKMEYTDMQHRVGRAHFLRDAVTTHGDEYKKIMQAALKN